MVKNDQYKKAVAENREANRKLFGFGEKQVATLNEQPCKCGCIRYSIEIQCKCIKCGATYAPDAELYIEEGESK